jgi:hypothetical protein
MLRERKRNSRLRRDAPNCCRFASQRNNARRPWLVQVMGRRPTKVAAIARLERDGFVIMRRPGLGGHSALGRGFRG